ncbi:coiled-coil domain-containing protein 12, partial [Phenoliferia sp. Uapishka_3]
MSSTMQDAATSRKEKLAMLKKRKELHDTNPDQPATAGAAKDQDGVFRFRNYDPETGGARKHLRMEEDDTVEKQVEGLAEKIIAEDEARRAEELPKKPNWDLKRDLDRKLSKLKGKTDQAIATLIRKRLQTEKGDAGAIVAGGTRADEVDEVGSDEE